MYRTEKIESWGKYRDTYRIVRWVYRFSPNSWRLQFEYRCLQIMDKCIFYGKVSGKS